MLGFVCGGDCGKGFLELGVLKREIVLEGFESAGQVADSQSRGFGIEHSRLGHRLGSGRCIRGADVEGIELFGDVIDSEIDDAGFPAGIT